LAKADLSEADREYLSGLQPGSTPKDDDINPTG
jgi:hypothetical protein